MCLKFEKNSSGLTRFCDSNYGGGLDARKSTSGYVFTMGRSTMSWQLSLQDVIAMSTTKAEYIYPLPNHLKRHNGLRD